jgi:hypothetical protein
MFLSEIRELVQAMSPKENTVIFSEDLYIPSSRRNPAYLITGISVIKKDVKLHVKSLESPNPLDLIESSPSSLIRTVYARLLYLKYSITFTNL